MKRYTPEYLELMIKFKKLKKKQKECLYCKRKFKKNIKSSIDHIYPLSLTKGKGNVIENLAKVCTKCNSEKNGIDPLKWLNSNGLLTDELIDIIEKAFRAIS